MAPVEFDAVLANFVFNHLPQPERAAAELARVLRPGGRVAFSIWDEDERNRWYGLARETLAEIGETPEGGPARGCARPDPLRRRVRGPRRCSPGPASTAILDAAPGVRPGRSPSGESLWANLLAGSVRTAARIQAQDAETQRRIRELFTKRAEEEFRRGEELLLRASVRSPRRGPLDARSRRRSGRRSPQEISASWRRSTWRQPPSTRVSGGGG